ncbi:MAG: hypothetical protein HOE80_04785, partial [Candidatus Magasanikbacteria bacterium]|nr:hypothetical protein [Candidatus Magasanikbacteria bacterium]
MLKKIIHMFLKRWALYSLLLLFFGGVGLGYVHFWVRPLFSFAAETSIDCAVSPNITSSQNSQSIVLTNGTCTLTETATLASLTINSGVTLQFADDVDLTVAGATSVTGVLSFGSGNELNGATDITVNSGGEITHSVYTIEAAFEPKVNINITGDVTVNSGGEINVAEKGYLGGRSGANIDYQQARTYGNLEPDDGVDAITDGSTGKAGGSHGGRGAPGAYTSAFAYDSIVSPIYPGGGGGTYYHTGNYIGGDGGGVVIISAANIIVAGSILADGENLINGSGEFYGGAGAGGSINLTASSAISGAGDITAIGGYVNSYSGLAGGGGGRIAIVSNSNTFSGSVNASSNVYGTGVTLGGSAGTFYKKISSNTYGDLYINNYANDKAYYNTTLVSPVTSTDQLANSGYAFDSVTVSSYGILNVPATVHDTDDDNPFLFYSASCTADNDTASDGEIVYDDTRTDEGVANDYTCVEAVVPGIDCSSNPTIVLSTDFNTGDDLILRGGGTCTLTIDQDERVGQANAQIALNSLTLNESTTLTHAVAGVTADHHNEIDLVITGALTINSGSSINIDGKGYLGAARGANGFDYGRTVGNTQTGGSYRNSGGSHGGRGGRYISYDVAEAYDSIVNPILPGSGGGGGTGGDGGGVVIITAASAVINGDISADGGLISSWSGCSAGGSVNLTVSGALSGSGAISSDGGSGDCYAGGGGRVALTYGSSSHSGTVSAYGGNSTGAYDENEGAAGTVYKYDSDDSYGDLYINNNGNLEAYYTTSLLTTIPTSDQLSDSGYAFSSVTVSNYGILNIPAAVDGSATTNGGSPEKFHCASCPTDNNTASDGEIEYDSALFSAVVTNNYICYEVGYNSIPTATAITPSQTDATTVTVATTIADTDSNVTSLIVEHSLDNSTWVSSTLFTATENGEGDGTVTSTGNIADIDTDNDGSIALTFTWDVSGINDSTVYMRIIPNDGTANGSTVTSSAFAVDTTAPTILTRETADLDGDGYIDAVHITFSENIGDDSVNSIHFAIAGTTMPTFNSTTNGDSADDDDIYITFTDGVLLTDST